VFCSGDTFNLIDRDFFELVGSHAWSKHNHRSLRYFAVDLFPNKPMHWMPTNVIGAFFVADFAVQIAFAIDPIAADRLCVVG
jgi:hypothetical protein